MTSIKKRKRVPTKKNKDLGSRVRHPSGVVSPNIIFSREDDKTKKTMRSEVARLYQDMIRYSVSPEYHDKLQKQKGFKVDDMGRWLLHHNPYLIGHYSGSKAKTRETDSLDKIRNTIKRYLEHLKKWWIVRKEDITPKMEYRPGYIAMAG